MRRRQLAPVFALALLAPFVAEFLLGDQYLMPDQGVAQQLGMFVTLGLWYGSAAVLIRETARRTGRGWPTILLLGLAFGLIEEGLLTQSLFNPHYLGLDLISYGHVGWLGTGVPWALFVLTIHVVWSIATPIALIEGIWPGREPWLGRIGMAVAAVVLIVGAAVVLGFSWLSSGFLAVPAQLIGAAVLAAIAVVAALRLPRVGTPRPSSRLLPAAALAVVLAVAFQLLHYYGWQLFPAWLTSALTLLLLAGAVAAAARWRLDVLGLVVGAVLTYGWVGVANAVSHGPAAVIEQIVIVAVALAVTGIALRRRHSAAISSSGVDSSGVDSSGSDAGAAATAANR